MKFSHAHWSLWTPKSPLGEKNFGIFFGLYFMKLFMGNNPYFIHFVMQIDRKCFFLRFFKKKSEISHFGRFYTTKFLHSGHFFITKFCQDAKKTILVKVWPLIKSLLAVCHSTADPKSLNFISKCIFMDSDRSVSAQMGFYYYPWPTQNSVYQASHCSTLLKKCVKCSPLWVFFLPQNMIG